MRGGSAADSYIYIYIYTLFSGLGVAYLDQRSGLLRYNLLTVLVHVTRR